MVDLTVSTHFFLIPPTTVQHLAVSDADIDDLLDSPAITVRPASTQPTQTGSNINGGILMSLFVTQGGIVPSISQS